MAVLNMTISLLLAFLLVLGSQGKVLSSEDSNASDEIRSDENSKAFAPLSSLNQEIEEEQMKPEQPLGSSQLSENNGKRLKRQAFSGDINGMDWVSHNPTHVTLSWQQIHGLRYDILVYRGYPVAGGPGLPLYRSIRGLNRHFYDLRHLQPYSDYLVHIRARDSYGQEGPWHSFGRVTPGN